MHMPAALSLLGSTSDPEAPCSDHWMPIPIILREEREADFCDPYVRTDESLWWATDEATRHEVRLRLLWRDIVVLHRQRDDVEDPRTRAVLGRYLVFKLCAAKDLLESFGRHVKQAEPERRDAYWRASKAFNVAVKPIHEEARAARNTFVAHRELPVASVPELEDMRRLRRFVELADLPQFAVVLEALHEVIVAACALGISRFARGWTDPETRRRIAARLSPLRVIR
jgi:hypothetical protein